MITGPAPDTAALAEPGENLDQGTAEPIDASPPLPSTGAPGADVGLPIADIPCGAAAVPPAPAPDPADTPEATAPALPVPIGAPPAAVTAWFDIIAEAARPESDGTLAAARASARAYRSRAKADNTREAYRSAVRAWCAWCDRHGLPPLPAAGPDIAAFLADERDRGLAPNTLDLRRAGIRRGAPDPNKKRAATLTVLHALLAPIPDDLRGLRDRALLLVGFAGALRRSELAAIQLRDLERTDLGFRLSLTRSKGAQTAAVTVPLPYGKTALCPVRALTAWLAATDATEGPVFRRIWVAPDAHRGLTPCPASAANPSPPARSAGSSRRAPPQRDSRRASSAATASSVARSPPAWSAAPTPPSSSGSAGTSGSTCSANTLNSATCSTAIRSATRCRPDAPCLP